MESGQKENGGCWANWFKLTKCTPRRLAFLKFNHRSLSCTFREITTDHVKWRTTLNVRHLQSFTSFSIKEYEEIPSSGFESPGKVGKKVGTVTSYVFQESCIWSKIWPPNLRRWLLINLAFEFTTLTESSLPCCFWLGGQKRTTSLVLNFLTTTTRFVKSRPRSALLKALIFQCMH